MKQLSPEARALIELTGGAHAPPAGAKARVLAQVEASLAAPSTVALQVESSLAPAARRGWAWAAGAAGIMAGVVGLSLLTSERGPKSTLPDPASSRAAAFEEARVVMPPHVEVDPSSPASSSAGPSTPSTRAPTLRSPTASRGAGSAGLSSSGPRPPAGEATTVLRSEETPEVVPAEVERPGRVSRLAAEARLLSAARAALRDGAALQALALTEQHEAEFPDGVLVEERLAARALAQCALGRRADAEATRRALEALAPSSPHRAHIDAACRR